MKLEIPRQVAEIIELLHAHTYAACLVGGCVRSLMQKENTLDFDIATDAEPGRIAAIFEERYKTAAGRLPGELVIILGAMAVSISPYRGISEDGRQICGARELTLDDDLRQRIYTADAIAYDLEKGLYDPLDGASCVSDHRVILRAVGEREAQEREEALKKLPAAKKGPVKPLMPVLLENPTASLEAIRRFSRGGVGISSFTLQALCENRKELLEAVPRDWLLDGLRDVLLGKRITDTLLAFRPFLFTLIPKLIETDGLNQRSAFQEYTLFEHIAKAVGYAVPDYTVRLALLLHGIGKSDCEADRGTYNSYDGHDERGAMLAREVMEEFSVPAGIREEVVFLILHHDDEINEKNYASFTAEYTAARVKNLLLLQSANHRAKNSDREHEQRAAELRALADGIKSPVSRTITSAELKKLIDWEQQG